MAQQTLKNLQYDGHDILVEASRRDGAGNLITTTYATKTELSTGLGEKQPTLTAGAGISISGTTISVNKAASNALGGIKIGSGLSVTSDGTVSVGEAGSVDWSNIDNKPFDSVSTGTGGDFVISSNKLTINDTKFTTKAFVQDNYVALTTYNNLVNTTLPAAYQAKITNDNKLAYSLITGAPTTVSSFTNDSGYITKAVANLENYYSKTETYTKSEVETLVNTVNSFEYVIVDSLPTLSTDADYEAVRNKIYLIPSTNAQSQNAKDEYIAIRSSSGTRAGEGTISPSYSWEQIGTTSVDLTNYLNSDANITNNTIVVGDGGTRKVKTSGISISSSTLSNSSTVVPTASAVYTAVSAKQDKLTNANNAGTGISISSAGVISTLFTATDVNLDY